MRWLCLLVLLGACVDRGPGMETRKIPPGYVNKHLLAAPPKDLERYDVKLGHGEVTYLGTRVDKKRIAPGETATLTHYWHVNTALGDGWRPFAIVRGPVGSPDFMNLDSTDMQYAYGPSKWRAGDIIEDEQKVSIRSDWRAPTATVFVGLIADGKHGTLDRMNATGAHTQDRAVIATQLEIDLQRAPPAPGTVHLQRAAGAITIDGNKTDPGWVGITVSPNFATGDGSGEPMGGAVAKLAWDDQHLYLYASVSDTDVFSPYKVHDESLWKADVIEIFIDADGNKRGYIELQVNPNNATFDSWFGGGREGGGKPAWESGIVTAVKVNGTPDKSDGTDTGWDVEMAIPWAAVKGEDAAMNVRLPPAIGDRWRMNVVRVDKKGQGNETVTVSSWNRISIGDFHALDRMLTAVFADERGIIVPKPEAPPPTQPSQPTLAPDPGSGSAAKGSGSDSGSD